MAKKKDFDLICLKKQAEDIDLIDLSDDSVTAATKKKIDLTDPLIYQLYTSDIINITLKDLVAGGKFKYTPPQTREQRKEAQFSQVMEYLDNVNRKHNQLLDSVNAVRIQFYNIF